MKFNTGQRCIFTGMVSNNQYLIEIINFDDLYDIEIKALSIIKENREPIRKLGKKFIVGSKALKILPNQDKI